MKKIIIIFLIVVVGAGTLYFILGGKAPSGLPIFTDSPFGTPPGDETPGTEGVGDGAGRQPLDDNAGFDENGKPVNALFKISEGPIAGAVSFLKNGASYLRYVDRATGHVYELNLSTFAKTQILNITRPKIYEVLWKTDGSGFVERTITNTDEDITNTSVTLVPPAGTSTDSSYSIRATLLRGSVGEMVINPDNSLLYNLTDTGAVTTSSFTGDKPKTLLTSAFTAWRILPVNNSLSVLATKPSSGALGYAYNLDLKSGRLTKILGPLLNLTVLPSPSNKKLAIGFSESGAQKLLVENTNLKIRTEILPTTLPEKCAWSKKIEGTLYCGVPKNGLGTNVPDSWYQGGVSYSDEVWRFNADTETAEILLEPEKEFGLSVDVTSPILSPGEDYLFFTNKKDLRLWAVKLVP